jgi:hypothetical protein
MKEILTFFDTSNFGYGNYNGYNTLKDFKTAFILYLSKLRALRQHDPLSIILITDEKGKEIMIDDFKIEFDGVEIIEINKFSKFDILSRSEGYLRIDLDVIPFSHFPLPLYTAEVVVQEIITSPNHNQWLYDFNKDFGVFNKSVRFTDAVYEKIKEAIYKNKLIGLKTGIIGGNNVALLNGYVDSVKEFKQKNQLHNDNFFEIVYSAYYFQLEKIIPAIPTVEYGKNVLTLYDKATCIQFTEKTKRNPIFLEATKTYIKYFFPKQFNKLTTLL